MSDRYMAKTYSRIKQMGLTHPVEIEWDGVSETWIVVYNHVVYDANTLEDAILQAYKESYQNGQ